MRLQLNVSGGRVGLLMLAGVAAGPASGAVLPEDRVDAMYHYYDGGGTEVAGPALLVRKDFAEKFSASASYYVDRVSGASIDVVTTASRYVETRKEVGVGLDFLHRDTTVGLSYSSSDERDYLADSFGVNISHEIFDGLTTVSLGYVVGRDQVGKTGTEFEEGINRYHYKLGWSQIFTRSFLVSLEYEGILEEGYLNSPYRAARLQGLLVPEVYPGTRDSYAVGLRAMKGLGAGEGPLISSLQLGYRYFWDTWDVRAHTLEAGYQRRLGGRWTLEPRLRYYRQSAASFYSDDFSQTMRYMARDKELSTFDSYSLGLRASYQLYENPEGTSRGTLNVAHDYVRFVYRDFTDVRSGDKYAFGANVVQLYFSALF